MVFLSGTGFAEKTRMLIPILFALLGVTGTIVDPQLLLERRRQSHQRIQVRQDRQEIGRLKAVEVTEPLASEDWHPTRLVTAIVQQR